MLIPTVCPGCKTTYNLGDSLNGQAIRCPNPLCRHVFTVGAKPAAPTPTPPPRPETRPARPSAKIQRSGSVGDMVPMLPAEEEQPAPAPAVPLPVAPVIAEVPDLLPVPDAEPIASEEPELLQVVEEEPLLLDPVKPKPKKSNGKSPKKKPPEKTAPAASSWEQAPPVVRQAPAAKPPLVPKVEAVPEVEEADIPKVTAAKEAAAKPEEPRELGPGAWETLAPPPIRHLDTGEQLAPNPFGTNDLLAAPTGYGPYAAAPAKKKRGLAIFVGLLLAVGVIGGGVFGFYRLVYYQTEAQLFAQSQEEYKEGKFSLAALHFKQLQDKFGSSEHKEEYAYLEKLSDLRGRLPEQKPNEAVTALETFVKNDTNTDFVVTYGDGLAKSAAPVLANFAGGVAVGENTPAELSRAEKLAADLTTLLGTNGFQPDDLKPLSTAVADGRAKYARWQVEQNVVAQLQQLPLPGQWWPDAIQTGNHLLRLNRMEQNADALKEMDRLYTAHANSFVYERIDAGLRPDDPVEEFKTIPTVAANRRSTTAVGDDIVLALARGVLYGLRRSDGQLKWYKRVGIDTTTLPVRVPPKAPYPAIILVVSTDAGTLTALNDDGQALWKYKIGRPSQGRPLIVERADYRLAYVPTLDGQIHVIELAQGKLVGYYDTKHRLTVGGVHQMGTDLLYFPADDTCVYVINAKEERLEHILYTDHRGTTLHGEPLIVASDSIALARGEGYLMLNQEDGLHGMRLRLFPLPITERRGPEAVIKPEPRVQGWTWFPPTYDGEKIAMLSDAGVLGLFGIKQAGTHDSLLYPRLATAGVSLDRFLAPATAAQGTAQVVQVQGNDFWVLAHGKLQHLQIAWTAAGGPQLVAAWHDPVPLGEARHASQVFPRGGGHNTLFLVTEALTDPAYVATAVDDDTGNVLWQRQLGLLCGATPLPLRVPGDNGNPVLLVMDRSGGLFAFDPDRVDYTPGERGERLAAAVEDNPDVQPVLIAADDGQSAYQIACPGKGATLLVRQVTFAGGRDLKVVAEQRVPLSSPMQGTPAVVGKILVVPLAEGTLVGLPLPLGNTTADLGSDAWRAEQAGPDTRGHVVALAPDRFLVNNGAHGFKVWQQKGKAGKLNWVTIPEDGDLPGLEILESGLTAAPVSLNAKNGTAEICVADAAGVVRTLTVAPSGAIQLTKRQWNLRGKVTAGPFVRTVGGALRVGCVVNERRLVWLDPNADGVLWTYEAQDRKLLGEPQLVDGMLVLTDRSSQSQVVAIDPATGKADGSGHRLRGSVGPVATPVAFDAKRLFVPLSDGTILLLPLDAVRKPKAQPATDQ